MAHLSHTGQTKIDIVVYSELDFNVPYQHKVMWLSSSSHGIFKWRPQQQRHHENHYIRDEDIVITLSEDLRILVIILSLS